MKRLVTNIQFWIWAATHSPNFKFFEISITSPVKMSISRIHYDLSYCIYVSFHSPSLQYSVDLLSAEEFINFNSSTFNTEYLYADIPF
jgi:hypothetical protein